jgi:hypothetical protein
MTMTPELRRRVDQIRDYLYGGGYQQGPAMQYRRPSTLISVEQTSTLVL